MITKRKDSKRTISPSLTGGSLHTLYFNVIALTTWNRKQKATNLQQTAEYLGVLQKVDALVTFLVHPLLPRKMYNIH